MPTVFRHGPYRFFFYATDRDEPVHIHVEREGKVAKFWLDPVRLDRSGSFKRSELGQVGDILIKHHDRLLEAWNDYFHG